MGNLITTEFIAPKYFTVKTMNSPFPIVLQVVQFEELELLCLCFLGLGFVFLGSEIHIQYPKTYGETPHIQLCLKIQIKSSCSDEIKVMSLPNTIYSTLQPMY